MAKFYGEVGFAETTETAPGVFSEDITEKLYFGDVTKNTRHLQSSETLNDNLTVQNQISIVADPYATENFFNIRYIKWLNVKWKVTDVEVLYPRLNLTLGSVYNAH